MLPEVSIVITVKNVEKTIADLLNSISKIDYAGKLETIVVDGESSDKTRDIISKYDFIKMVTSKCNISKGRNIGVENSSGEIIAFTDGDCVVDRDWIKNIVNHLQRDPEIAAIGGPYLPIHQSNIISEYFATMITSYFPTKPGYISRFDEIGTGNAAYRRKAFEEVGGFDETLALGVDYDLNLRISKLGHKLLYAEDVVVYHRFRTTLRQATDWAFNHGRAYAFYQKRLGKRFYSYLTKPFLRLSLMAGLGISFILSLLESNYLVTYIELLMMMSYCLYKIMGFRRIPYFSKISVKVKIVAPILDLYVINVTYLGCLTNSIFSIS